MLPWLALPRPSPSAPALPNMASPRRSCGTVIFIGATWGLKRCVGWPFMPGERQRILRLKYTFILFILLVGVGKTQDHYRPCARPRWNLFIKITRRMEYPTVRCTKGAEIGKSVIPKSCGDDKFPHQWEIIVSMHHPTSGSGRVSHF